METLHMDEQTRGLSQEQQNQCRATLDRFIDRHALSGWEMTIEVQETLPAGYSVKIAIEPPPGSGLSSWPIHELAVVNTQVDVAAELDRLLEAAFQAAPSNAKAQ
jgi:hypothetical protein